MAWIGVVIGACLVLLQQGVKADFLYSNCGLSDPMSSRITDGRDAPLGSAPFMAYLMKNNKYRCGGSIINHRYVLTAAHCVGKNMTVRLGEYDNRSNPDCVAKVCMPRHQDFGIAVIGYHQQYNGAQQFNDIALIKLNRRIIFNANIQPICLHQSTATARKVNKYHAYGWGLTYFRGTEAHVLQTTNLTHFPNTYCENQLRKSLTHNQICAGSNGTDTCGADSGGPLITELTMDDEQTRYVQLGIVSYGNPFCLGTGVYTYAPSYASWIFRTMNLYGMS